MPDMNVVGTSLGWKNTSLSSLHKVILSCENTGGSLSGTNANLSIPSFGSEVVRGMLMGITRDRQITENLYPSNNINDHKLSSTGFYIAPTQSFNSSDITFVNNAKNINNCVSGPGYHRMFIHGATETVDGKE